ncbi:MAG: hypothetical protein P8J87_12850 [Verrucomicrobiales bacterium]|nr:hypothetical protein [Verrucomicrobiales bacterium]
MIRFFPQHHIHLLDEVIHILRPDQERSNETAQAALMLSDQLNDFRLLG